MAVCDTVRPLVLPILAEHGLDLWDLEFVKEGSEWFLRVIIDRESGVGIEDCEAVSRALDPLLDEADPIPQSYHLEVCSAGLIRDLKTPEQIRRFLGREVQIRLFKAGTDGKKNFSATLAGADENTVRVLRDGNESVLDRKSVSKIEIDLI